MKQHFFAVGRGLASILVGTIGLASAATAESLPERPNLGCSGRTATPAAVDSTELLDSAMKLHRFEYNDQASLTSVEALLTQYYGMRQSLRSVAVEADRRALGRISSLMQNNYVIAGQMALGAELKEPHLPTQILTPLSNFVTNSTEPFHGDDELTTINDKISKATIVIDSMQPKPRAFGRWVVRATAFDDPVAFDAAMSGLCRSSPAIVDFSALKKAYDIAKLDRGRSYRESDVYSGGEPSLSKRKQK